MLWNFINTIEKGEREMQTKNIKNTFMGKKDLITTQEYLLDRLELPEETKTIIKDLTRTAYGVGLLEGLGRGVELTIASIEKDMKKKRYE